jgi:hypothetical protein
VRRAGAIRRALLGLAIGLVVYGGTSFLLSITGLYRIDLEAMAPVAVSVYYAIYLGEAFPVLLGGGVAGYISGRLGMISGAVFGICQGAILYVIWLGDSSADVYPYLEGFASMYAPPGVLGRYLGYRLALARKPRQ